jgi:hypothetical protein
MGNEKIKNLVKGMMFGLVVVLLASANIGCSKKKSNGNPNAGWWGGGYGYGGPGYGGYGAISNVGAGIDQAGRYMVILAASTQADPMYGMGSGPAFVEGEMRVAAPLVCGGMNQGLALPPDIYRLIPANSTPGYLDVDMLTGVTLIAQGAYAQAMIRIDYARYFQTNVCGFEGMMGQLDIVDVNGFRCGLLTGFTDMAAGQMCY